MVQIMLSIRLKLRKKSIFFWFFFSVSHLFPIFSLFQNVLSSLMIPYYPKLTAMIDRKMAAIALTKILTESEIMQRDPYVQQWPVLLRIALQVLEGSADTTLIPEDLEAEIQVEQE